jgi:2-C-methyl-D-erythritol 4-phosphate cytidylyltransferase
MLRGRSPFRVMSRLIALIPAAGGGSRFGAALPKQYLTLAGRPLLHHALASLLAHPRIELAYVVLAPGDTHFRTSDWSAFGERLVPLYCGGATRAASVYNGLVAVHDAVAADDWVLVHDAARPCLRREALDRLIEAVDEDDAGGLLAVPVADTLKRADGTLRVADTAPRDGLWRAQTPQMFRYRLLIEALHAVPLAQITDEASAVEALGVHPRLVHGDACNVKVTYAEDARLAELILADAAARCAASRQDAP